MSCEHELGERETACADGMCPLCLAKDNKSLRETIKYMRLLMLKMDVLFVPKMSKGE